MVVELEKPAPAGGVTVTMVSSDPGSLGLPPITAIPSGATTATFRADALGDKGIVQVTANADGYTAVTASDGRGVINPENADPTEGCEIRDLQRDTTSTRRDPRRQVEAI